MTEKKGFTHDSVANKTVEWYTPKWIFNALNLKFDLDPCHPEEKLDWIPAAKHYSEKDNGLIQEWTGRIWLNPPYGKHTSEWLAKMHDHRNGIALVFARTDCKWFHDYCTKADAILFIKSRVKFIDGLGVTSKSGAGSGSMLIAWGSDNVEALKKMRDKGFLVVN
jgi:phage N-6-adenine-methyltransferase